MPRRSSPSFSCLPRPLLATMVVTVLAAASAGAIGGESCFTATPIVNLGCLGDFVVEEPMGIATALAGTGPVGSCWEAGDGAQNDRWYSWRNETPDVVWFAASADDVANYPGDSQVAVYSDCAGTFEHACAEHAPWGSSSLGLGAYSTLFPVAPNETVMVQFDGFQGNRAFERALFTCWPCELEAPFEATDGNTLRAYKLNRRDVGIVLDPSQPHVLAIYGYINSDNPRFTEVTRIAVTTSTSLVDPGAVERVTEPPLFYRLDRATLDDCRR